MPSVVRSGPSGVYPTALCNCLMCSVSLPPTEEFLLEQPKNYTFLTYGNVSVNGVDDAHEFKSTVEAMHIMGMNQDDFQCE